jgi:hypothetical protein
MVDEELESPRAAGAGPYIDEGEAAIWMAKEQSSEKEV